MEKKIINTTAAPAPIGPYNQATQFGNMLFVSGQIPMDSATGTIVSSGIQDETRKVLENVQAILEAAGMDFSHVLKSTIFITDMAQFGEINEVYAQFFTANEPARETVQVAGLPRGVNIEISVIAAK
ncbi:reactive intermediate/imine deaminase [Taibaiella sp. KBW10]|uniref:RidA family protein n=1 Tax=Taibaiella sp. KBW10 TaxID=2153357 RepID=UPI000F5B5261|nr:RidA family protein [Taibaiella sp. KBW10]RQO29899.1 reactive intermediate/imine deaminase [Taibaiella sp. KBW10]